MVRRIISVIVFALCFPLIFPAAFFTALVMPIIALVIYIAKGDKDDTLIDFILAPFVWTINLPYKIMGKE